MKNGSDIFTFSKLQTLKPPQPKRTKMLQENDAFNEMASVLIGWHEWRKETWEKRHRNSARWWPEHRTCMRISTANSIAHGVAHHELNYIIFMELKFCFLLASAIFISRLFALHPRDPVPCHPVGIFNV